MNTENRVHQMKTIQAEALELFKKKNVDYSDAFAAYLWTNWGFNSN